MRGASGTLYGETNYDTEVSAPMWPFPHEDMIKAQMSAYNNLGVSGNRGFASTTATQRNGQPTTLTSYIWEYLGNTMPASIYGAVPAADTTAPTASITGPTAGSSVTGTVSVTASASDNVGVSKLEFYVNGALQATDTATPYLYSWNTSSLAAGTYTLMAKAYDAAGNVGQSGNVNVTVAKDTTAPTASISSPVNSAAVSGTIAVTASASDNIGVTKIELYDNGALLIAGNVLPLNYNWNTAAVANGTHTLTAKAYDAAGNVGQSSGVTVTVSNTAAVADTIAPTVAISAPSNGATVSGTASVTAAASDNVGVSKVEFYVNGALKSTSTAAPFSYSWNTTAVANGTYTLSAKAYDAAGNVGQSSNVSVGVSNLVPATTTPISFVQVEATTPQYAKAKVSIYFPNAQKAGNMNVVVIGWNDTSSNVQSVTDSLGNVYTLAAGPVTGTGLRQAIYYAKGIKAGSNLVTVTFDQAANYPDMRMMEYAGVSTVDKTASASGNGSTSSTGSVTTTAANALIVSANMVSTGTSCAGNGYNKRMITSPDSDIAQDRIVSSIGTYSAAAPLTSSGAWVMQTVAFK